MIFLLKVLYRANFPLGGSTSRTGSKFKSQVRGVFREFTHFFFQKINFAPILNFEMVRDPLVKKRLDFLKVELDFIFF